MNISLSSVCISAQLMLVSIVAERWVAVVFLSNYEKGYRKLGPALIVAAVVITIGICLFLYWGETFDEPQINARVLPSTIFLRGNTLIFVLLATNFTGFALTIALRFVRPKLQIR
ncbi:hypothetical protein COOONC_22521 [Cooperia oncophora]